MKVLARKVRLSDCPPSIASMGFGCSDNILLTAGKEYIVYAISAFKTVIYFLLVDDLGWPEWYPAWFFENSDMSLPGDWICHIEDGEPELIMGPSFVAKDVDAYVSMVELDPEPVELFWERVKASCEVTQLPDEVDLYAFFDADTLEPRREDGYLCYQYSDSRSRLVLQFKVNIHEKSVRTVLSLDGNEVQVVASKGAGCVQIERDDSLRVTFDSGSSWLEIRLRPSIHVAWRT